VALYDGQHVLVSDKEGRPRRWAPDYKTALNAATERARQAPVPPDMIMQDVDNAKSAFDAQRALDAKLWGN
jgi:hypothetical protein